MKAGLSFASEKFTWRYSCSWVSCVETWKDRVALMWSMWNPQLNPHNPGANLIWIRSNRLWHERTASHTLTEQNLLATLIWGCFYIIINLYLCSHISQPDHMDNRWACEKSSGPTGKYGALVDPGNSWERNRAEISHFLTLISPFIYFIFLIHVTDFINFSPASNINVIFNYYQTKRHHRISNTQVYLLFSHLILWPWVLFS